MLGAVNSAAEGELRRKFRVRTMPTIITLRVGTKGKLNVLEELAVREEDGYREIVGKLGAILRRYPRFAAAGAAIDQVHSAVRLEAHSQQPVAIKPLVHGVPLAEEVESDAVTAALLSLDSFHVMDETGRLYGERLDAMREWLWLLSETRILPMKLALERELDSSEWESWVSSHEHGSMRSWRHCNGAGRGYPCGLWQLLHVMAARAEPAPRALRAMRLYVRHFFLCGPCSEHFVTAADTTTANLTSQMDLMLWLWKLHNLVNTRISARALSGGTSANAPRDDVVFPSVLQCARCRQREGESSALNSAGVMWDQGAIYSFLQSIYSAPAPHREL